MTARLFAGLRRLRLALGSAFYRTYLRLAYPGVRCHGSVRFGRGARVRAFAGGTVELGAGVFVQDYALVLAEGGRLTLGERCEVGRWTVIAAREEIAIGAGTLIAEHVSIRDADHGTAGEVPLAARPMVTAPVRIGRDVWLGAKVTVTKGVGIAPFAVVGANSVVTRSLSERGTYAGAPAALLGRRAG